ncbi:hypothetical protein BT93_L5896 [Corymbia citriodora subsp. variegata]|uniref:EF-hand domain-containing protein n=1 Tax=Corymbia citriodora subsp. variegata TaxID=360336 RepID=A0A8T0CVN4_CORYI|nr:hypothetical protein BT93_L5896 [Corymbia citriodora subsp. variegata]
MDIGEICEAVSAEIGIEKVRKAASVDITIEKVHEAASAHYEDLTEDQKQAARSFFEAMDKDKSNNISIDEFMDFLSLAGFQTDNHDWLFEELDKDNNGTLNFKELVTFFYVLSHDDEYKHLLNCRPSADQPIPKAKNVRQTTGANDQGQGRNMGDFSGMYNKLKGVYKLGERMNENACSIL